MAARHHRQNIFPLATRRQVMAAVGLFLASTALPAENRSPYRSGLVARKSALVIGNNNYRTARLKNPVHDANLMDRTLRGLGYEVVTLLNASLQQMIDANRAWISAIADAEVRLLYYAGHGVQSKGINFLIPVDNEYVAEDDVATKAFNVGNVIERLSRFEGGVNIIILDACRSPPEPSFDSRMKGRSIGKSLTPGLVATAAPKGTLIAFSTAPGLVASDSRNAENSIYTRHLAEQMSVLGEPIEAVFKQVRSAVMQETQNAQIPWESSSLVGDFCFRPTDSGSCESSAVNKTDEQRTVDLKKL